MTVRRFDIPSRVPVSRLREIASLSDAAYTLIYTNPMELKWVDLGLERMLQVASYTGAAMLYADHFRSEEGGVFPGSLTL